MKYINDVGTTDGKYNFTDGCGTMSTSLRDQVSFVFEIFDELLSRID